MKTALASTLLVGAVAGGVVVGKASNPAAVSNVESVCIGSDGTTTVEVRTTLGKLGHTTFVRDGAKCTKLSPIACKALTGAMDAAKTWAAAQDFTKETP